MSDPIERDVNVVPCPQCSRGIIPADPTPDCPTCFGEGWVEERDFSPATTVRYATLGRACERHGLGWYNDDGEMRFQAPSDVIEEQAAERATAPLHARISELERERDEAVRLRKSGGDTFSDVFAIMGGDKERAEARAQSAEGLVERVVEVLGPFVLMAARHYREPDWRELPFPLAVAVDRSFLTVGDFRKASALLSEIKTAQRQDQKGSDQPATSESSRADPSQPSKVTLPEEAEGR